MKMINEINKGNLDSEYQNHQLNRLLYDKVTIFACMTRMYNSLRLMLACTISSAISIEKHLNR